MFSFGGFFAFIFLVIFGFVLLTQFDFCGIFVVFIYFFWLYFVGFFTDSTFFWYFPRCFLLVFVSVFVGFFYWCDIITWDFRVFDIFLCIYFFFFLFFFVFLVLVCC